MSTRDGACTSIDRLAEPPTFGLSYAFDDKDEPTLVTVYSGREDEITTHWISIEMEHAVEFEAIA